MAISVNRKTDTTPQHSAAQVRAKSENSGCPPQARGLAPSHPIRLRGGTAVPGSSTQNLLQKSLKNRTRENELTWCQMGPQVEAQIHPKPLKIGFQRASETCLEVGVFLDRPWGGLCAPNITNSISKTHLAGRQNKHFVKHFGLHFASLLGRCSAFGGFQEASKKYAKTDCYKCRNIVQNEIQMG